MRLKSAIIRTTLQTNNVIHVWLGIGDVTNVKDVKSRNSIANDIYYGKTTTDEN